MQIIADNTRNGELVILVEHLDDLWVLYNTIQPGDRIKGRTVRRVVLREGDTGERRPMTLTINVQKIEFHEFSNALRVLGTILEGPDDFVAIGQHHTFSLEPATKVHLYKDQWLRSDIERIRKSLEQQAKFMVLMIAIESGLANLALLSNYSLTPLTEVNENIPGKRFEKQYQKEALNEFYAHISQIVLENLKKFNIQVVIICGPGFTKEHYSEFLREQLNVTKQKLDVRVMNASSGELSGIYEILRSGEVASTLSSFKVAQDEVLLSEFVETLGKSPDKVVYGLKGVEPAAQMGAIKKLLLCDTLLRTGDKDRRKIIDSILTATESNRGEVHILSTDNPAGDQLERYGSIAAIVRFAVNQEE